MTLEQRTDLMRQATQAALKTYDKSEQQIAFVEGFVQCAFYIDVHLLSIIDIAEQEPQPGERVFAVSVDINDKDDDFDVDVQMLRYDKATFERIGVKYWLPFTMNVRTETK